MLCRRQFSDRPSPCTDRALRVPEGEADPTDKGRIERRGHP
jgi:hypothetical protein